MYVVKIQQYKNEECGIIVIVVNGILLPTRRGRTDCYLQQFTPPNQQIDQP